MTDQLDNQNEFDRAEIEDLFSNVVKAGKRTYFFDVKATRSDEYYLTITESKKRMGKDGNMFYEKHKIFLYKEDFDNFMGGLTEAVNFIKSNQEVLPRIAAEYGNEASLAEVNDELTTLNFEDLDTK
ncbi:MAG: PUR family DNA/RNA-binding protein [Bacteroidales bacterium]|jgi:hypothetical protein|nr:PUR family DNA/RNA-binding protein [Bacteroidales bacterium]HNT41212.1 DUF3276 family protein [Tenuifilaceae bacterium]MBP8642623.1 PUR family DNA/RNA-binding protein [Bacteroidales bacterium]NLI87202.1 PUR family DNA/RNA-binding protein [Bacteroidales bacterium]HOA09778.1 DUF3276 family protein [Tenuifilaceae bacterium]